MIERLDEVVEEVKLLHLIYHRNKNQHRNQHWWKFFRILLSNLKKFVLGEISLDTILRKKILKKCYYEFNGIIALGQFINLGFVLVGCISKIGYILESNFDNNNNIKTSKPISNGNATGEVGHDIGYDMGEDIGEDITSAINEVSDKETAKEGIAIVDKLEYSQTSMPTQNVVNSKKHELDDTLKEKKKKRKLDDGKKKKKKKKSDIDKLFG